MTDAIEYLYEHQDSKMRCCKCRSEVLLDSCPNDKCSNFKVQAGPRPKVTSQQLAELAFRSLTERGKTRLANQAIEDLEAQQPYAGFEKAILAEAMRQARCRYPECQNPMQWMNGYCDDHNQLVQKQIQHGDCWIDKDGIVVHAGGCIGDKCQLGPGSVVL